MYDIASLVLLLVTVCSFCCNLFALVIICRVYNRDRENISLRILINLILCGLFLSLMGFITTVGFLLLDNTDLDILPFHDTYCRTLTYLQNICYVEIFMTLTAISLERWCVVCRPLQAKHVITERKLYCFLFFSWMTSVLIDLPLPLFITGTKMVYKSSLDRTVLTCQEARHLEDFAIKLLSLAIFVGVFIVPVVIMVIMYSKIIRDLLCQSRPGVIIEGPNKFMQQRHRAAKASLLISAQFTLCYGPFSVYVFYLSFGGRQDESLGVVLGSVIPMIGVLLNPVLFCYALEGFREEIRTVLSCAPCRVTVKRLQGNLYDVNRLNHVGTAL